MSQFFFFLAAIFAISGAVGVVMLRNPFYSVLSLVVHLISLAALFLLLRAEFVAAAQVVVYAGAVMVLYVFVVAYVGGGEDDLPGGTALRILGPLFALGLAIELCIAMLGSALRGISSKGAPYVLGFGTPRHIGTLFLTRFLFPFELASLLLMVAAIGAVVLARQRRGLGYDPEEQEALRIRTRRPAYTGTMAEAAGVRHIVEGGPGELEPESGPVGAKRGTPAPDRQGGW